MNAKKLLSILLSLVMLATILNTVACAEGGYGDSSDFVEDDISDAIVYEVDPEYTVCYNDFSTAKSNSLSSGYSIADSGDPAYGMALKVPASGWAALGQSTYPTTYTWNNNTYNMFYESCTVGQSYIMMFDAFVTAAHNTPFSITPQHQEFYSIDTKDYRFYPDGTIVNEWQHIITQFTADSNKLKTKINTCASNTVSYIDNLIFVEAAEFVVSDTTGDTAVKDALGNLISGNLAKSGGIWATKGAPARFSIQTKGISVVRSVKHGQTVLTPDKNGNYYIEKVTDDIYVEIGLDEELLKSKVSIDEGKAYLPLDATKYEVSYSSDISKDAIIVKDSLGNAKKNDIKISKGDQLKFAIGEESTDCYEVGVLGDYNNDNKVTVTDIVSGANHVLKGTATISTAAADYDVNGKVTVTDVIRNRKVLLGTDTRAYSSDSDLIAEMDAFTQDVITRSGVSGITVDTLNKGIYNEGNRSRIANVMKKAMRGEEITIVYFGGSITARAGHSSYPNTESGITPNFKTSNNSYTDWITYWWEQTFEEKYGCNIKVQNAGIGATDTPYAVHRMHYDVLPYDPDLVIVEWCVNDDKNLTYKQGTYEAMVRQFLEHEDIALLMLSMATKTGGSSQSLHEPISKLYDVPMVSYRDAYSDNPHFTNFTTDDTHPNIVGHPLAGLLVDNYLQGIYEEIATIGSFDSPISETLVHEEADDYYGAYIASFKDIYDGKVEGVKITSLGSFSFENSMNTHGFRGYYGMVAKAASSYQPVVIEIDKLKTAFILVNRDGMNTGSTFEIDINGERKVDNSSYTCKHGSDNSQTESKYHWCTTRICYYPEGEKVVMKIYPTMDYSKNPSSYLRLFALMLS